MRNHTWRFGRGDGQRVFGALGKNVEVSLTGKSALGKNVEVCLTGKSAIRRFWMRQWSESGDALGYTRRERRRWCGTLIYSVSMDGATWSGEYVGLKSAVSALLLARQERRKWSTA